MTTAEGLYFLSQQYEDAYCNLCKKDSFICKCLSNNSCDGSLPQLHFTSIAQAQNFLDLLGYLDSSDQATVLNSP